MTKILILLLLLATYSFSSLADDDVSIVRAKLEQEFNDPESLLNKKVQELRVDARVPESSVYSLLGSDLLFHGNKESHHECQEKGCFAYENGYYRQVSEIRWMSEDGSNPQLILWPLGTDVTLFKTWESNEAGERIKLIEARPEITDVFFF